MKLFIVVRGAKERTETLCVQIAKELVGEDNVVLLNEPSFAEAHIKSMEIGASLKGYDYVIFLDADILLIKDNFHEKIKRGIEELNDPNFFKFNFRVFDRQCICPVYAGVHIYNIPILKRALSFKQVAVGAQRPETAVAISMVKKGYKCYITQEILAFHGYEQSYLDMYRTAFVRGVKYQSHWDFYLTTFYENREKDLDFFWSFTGLMDGIKYFAEGNKKASLSKRDYIDKFRNHLKERGLVEKKPLTSETILPNLFEELTKENPLFNKNKGWLSPEKVGIVGDGRMKKVLKRIKAKLNSITNG